VRISFTSAALIEIKEASEFYEAASPGLGAKFLDEIEFATERIRANPLAWAPLSKKLRRCRTQRFPFGLLYHIKPDEIIVVSAADLRRDPRRWREYL
jgi:hypothetical protein